MKYNISQQIKSKLLKKFALVKETYTKLYGHGLLDKSEPIEPYWIHFDFCMDQGRTK